MVFWSNKVLNSGYKYKINEVTKADNYLVILKIMDKENITKKVKDLEGLIIKIRDWVKYNAYLFFIFWLKKILSFHAYSDVLK